MMAEEGGFNSSRAGTLYTTNPFENAVQFAQEVKTAVTTQFDWTKDHILGRTDLGAIQLTTNAINALEAKQ